MYGRPLRAVRRIGRALPPRLAVARAGNSGTSFTDTFNRADVTPMDNGWVYLDQTNQAAVQISGNAAFGTVEASASPPPYNDAIILRPGFGANHKVSAIVRVNSASSLCEVELWLRGSEGVSRTNSIGTSKAYGYEINTNQQGDYLNVSRFFDSAPLTGGTLTNIGAWTNGDTFEAQIVGQTITVWVRGTQVLTVSDNAAGNYTSGDPGIGFFVSNGGGTTRFGIDSVTITQL